MVTRPDGCTPPPEPQPHDFVIDAVIDGQPARLVLDGRAGLPSVDLGTAPRAQAVAYMAGRQDGEVAGYERGYEAGWAACDAEISAIQRAAHGVVQAAARTEEHAVRWARATGRIPRGGAAA